MAGKEIRVDNGGADGWTETAIQKAVDRAAADGGGVVEVPKGEYRMRDALRLRSGVRVVGGRGAALVKEPSVASRIVDWLGYGHYEITVAEPGKFQAGMGVHVYDSQSAGFYTTVATIVGVDGERLFIDRMLNHDYTPAAGAMAVSAFSLVEAVGVADASVEGLLLDGNKAAETFELNGCRGGGVFLYQSRRVAVRGVEVRNYRGDAVSFQQNIDITVEDCEIHHNTGGGLHPGSGSARYLLRGNRVHHNGGCGIFYCLRTTHSICRDNLVEDNGHAGVSIGERDTDHLLAGNTIRGNGGPGVVFRAALRRGGDRTRLEGNTIGGNCLAEGGAEIELLRGARQVQIKDNAITPGKAPAVSVGEACADIFIEGNTIAGRALELGDIVGQGRLTARTAPAAFPAVGPMAFPRDGARHLGVEDAGPCALDLR